MFIDLVCLCFGDGFNLCLMLLYQKLLAIYQRVVSASSVALLGKCTFYFLLHGFVCVFIIHGLLFPFHHNGLEVAYGRLKHTMSASSMWDGEAHASYTSFCSIVLWQLVKSVYQRFSLSVKCSACVSCNSDWMASLTLVYFVLVVDVGVGGSGRLLTVILRIVIIDEREKNKLKDMQLRSIYTQNHIAPLVDEEIPLELIS